ncbi:MAG TPA: hypothetical protein VNI78_00510 [Vicinamibacterales bacterium]|nr:hypothetical protein [Vicinamibacterales bacterium]
MLDEIFIDGTPFITGKRAATIAGVSPDYVTRWCRQGALDGRRLAGGVWFVNVHSLEKFLVDREVRKRAWREELRRLRHSEYQRTQVRLA